MYKRQNLYGLLEGANKHGLHAEAHEGSAKEFIDAVNKAEISLPAVVRIVNRFNYEHFIVVSVSYTHLDVYKRQMLMLYGGEVTTSLTDLSSI